MITCYMSQIMKCTNFTLGKLMKTGHEGNKKKNMIFHLFYILLGNKIFKEIMSGFCMCLTKHSTLFDPPPWPDFQA